MTKTRQRRGTRTPRCSASASSRTLDGEHRWLTVGSPAGVDGVELLLEPAALPAAREYQAALYAQGVPCTTFPVADMAAAVRALKARGARFTMEPMEAHDATLRRSSLSVPRQMLSVHRRAQSGEHSPWTSPGGESATKQPTI